MGPNGQPISSQACQSQRIPIIGQHTIAGPLFSRRLYVRDG